MLSLFPPAVQSTGPRLKFSDILFLLLLIRPNDQKTSSRSTKGSRITTVLHHFTSFVDKYKAVKQIPNLLDYRKEVILIRVIKNTIDFGRNVFR